VSDSKTSYSHQKLPRFWWSAVSYYYYFYNSDKIVNFVGPAGMGIIIKFRYKCFVSGIAGLGIETSGIKHIASNYKITI
jgi:hypothetical protein